MRSSSRLRSAGLGLIVLVTAACAAGTPQPSAAPGEQEFRLPRSSLYSLQELAGLTLCVGLGDVAWRIADDKRRGRPLDAVLAEYEQHAQGRLLQSIARDVYRREGSAFAAVNGLLMECVPRLGLVTGTQAAPARYCLTVQHVALEAYALRRRGVPRESALQQFEQLAFARSVVDRVYERELRPWSQRSQLTLGEWVACIEAA